MALVRIFARSAAVICTMLVSAAATDVATTSKETSQENSHEKPGFISLSSAPAAPPESAEARIALRQHRPVSALNRYTFAGNVLEGVGDHVEHWIVMFCSGWHDKCQGLLPSYELLGVQWENKANSELVMSSNVRFAKVDCATEKALCVSLDINDYPSVVHYRHNRRINSWHGGAPGLVRFVKQELEGPKKRRAASATKAKSLSTCTMDDAPGMKKATEASDSKPAYLVGLLHVAASPWRTLCLAALLVVVIRSAWGLACVRPVALKSRAGQVTTAQRKAVPSSSLQAALPQEWCRQRQSIEL